MPSADGTAEKPPTPEEEFRRLMEGVRAGSPEAARELCARYGRYIRHIVRRRLHQRLRTQYDSLDFMQEVWASFFAGTEKYDFNDASTLLRYLSDMAYNKVAMAARRRFQVQKTDIRREERLDGVGGGASPLDEPPVRGPTPSQVAIANERWEQLLEGQPEQYRLMLEMRRQGYTHQEIAERTGLNPKMIQRLLRKMAQ